MVTTNIKPENPFHITYKFLNGSNTGSILSNKEFHVCYAVVDIDIIKTKMKKIVGCFVNPNDLKLDDDFDKSIHYFQIYMNLNTIVDISDILKNTVQSKHYSSSIAKKALLNSKDVTIPKIISKCVTTLKEKVLIT